MTAGTGVVQLREAMKQLRERWEQTKLHWHDPVQCQFEEEFLQPLEQQVRHTSQAMDELTRLLIQCKHDCG